MPELPSFDLVVATVDRVAELDRLLASFERQTHRRLRVIVVDQNEDDRLVPVLAAHGLPVLHLRSPRGLSRARNRALPELDADLVAFPDDDCVYPDDLLEHVAGRFAVDAELDGLSGREVRNDGTSPASWKTDGATLTDDNLWNRVISFGIFLRRRVVERVGAFDEKLGLGSGSTWSSGEEVDYVVRAVRAGARIEYDPSLTIAHPTRSRSGTEGRAIGYRDGASVGYILRARRYPARVVGRMLVRPVGGAALALLHADTGRARLHLATLRGRITGYRGARRAAG